MYKFTPEEEKILMLANSRQIVKVVNNRVHFQNKPVGVCGEMGGDPASALSGKKLFKPKGNRNGRQRKKR